MKKIGFIFACVLAWSALELQAAVRVWNDSTGDHLWTNNANWSGTAKPTAADTASFAESKVGPVTVDADATAGILYWTNQLGGLYNVTLNPGVTLSPTSAYVCSLGYTSSVSISGGGTLQVGGSAASVFYTGYRTSSSIPMDGRMVIQNSILNLYKLNNLGVGVNTDGGNQAGYGELNLANATIVSDNTQTNRLKVSNILYVGAYKIGGLLLLPSAVTNIEAGTISLGPYSQSTPGYGVLNLGESPQLRTLVATNSLYVYRGRIVWTESGLTKTGMPPNVSIRVGSPGNPGSFWLGHTAGSTTEVRWGDFKGLETYLASLIIGRQVSGSGANPSIGELDLQSTNTTSLTGSINSDSMNVPYVVIGGLDGGVDYCQQGILKLPRTLSEMTVNDLYFGGYGPCLKNSEINLGSNSQFKVFCISNVLQIGCGNILYTDTLGNSRTGFPGNVYLKVGVSSGQRGKLIVQRTKTSNTVYGMGNMTRLNGIGRVEAYLNEFALGESTGPGNTYSHYGEIDLRGCTNMLLDVDGTTSIGATPNTSSPNGYGFVYLPAGTATMGFLKVGGDRASIYGGGELWLSNTVIVVTNTVIGQTGLVTNQINGLSSGLDSAGPTISLVASNATSANKFGRLFLNFQADPVNAAKPYWGLKVKGNEIPYVQGLTNSMNVTVIKTGLSPANQAKLGVYYNTSGDYTYLGLPASAVNGSLLIIK